MARGGGQRAVAVDGHGARHETVERGLVVAAAVAAVVAAVARAEIQIKKVNFPNLSLEMRFSVDLLGTRGQHL